MCNSPVSPDASSSELLVCGASQCGDRDDDGEVHLQEAVANRAPNVAGTVVESAARHGRRRLADDGAVQAGEGQPRPLGAGVPRKPVSQLVQQASSRTLCILKSSSITINVTSIYLPLPS